MKLLPYHPADQLVTRADMHAQTALLQGDMTELRSDIQGDMSELRGDFDNKFADLKVATQRLVMGGVAANVAALIGGMLM